VGDVQQHSGLGNFGPVSLEPTVYLPASQVPDGFFELVHTWFSPKWVVRAGGPMGTLAPRIQAAVADVDSLLPIAKFQTIDDLAVKVTAEQRYHATLFSLLAGLALVLAAVGLYGLISQTITERTHELGVRMALGATVRQAVLTVIRPGMLLVLAGAVAGYGLSRAAARFLEHLLWGVRPADPLTFAAAAALLVGIAVVASAVPALRILRIDPAQTLREE